jgi:hypothetical protein
VVVGIFFIFFGVIALLTAPRWAEKVVEKFRQLNSEVDPNFFKMPLGIVGIVAIILGLIEITRALRSH